TEVQPTLRTRWSAVDRSGEAAASLVTAVAILGAKRAAADGATGLQPAVPLVCGTDVFQGPGAHAGSLKHSFKRFWDKHGQVSCLVTNISRWMGHCWKLG